jgi:ribosome-associated protein
MLAFKFKMWYNKLTIKEVRNMKKIVINSEFITLGQLLKLVDVISSGGEAKYYLQNTKITINGMHETRRGRKVRSGDTVAFLDQNITVLSSYEDRKH